MSKKIFIMIMILFCAGSVLAEQTKEELAKKGEPVGLAASLDYYSNYLWRGTEFFSGDGAFVPKLSWTVFSTGLTLSVAGEVAASWVFNGWWEKPGKYDYRIDSSGNITRKNLNFNHVAYATQSLDVGADYSYTIGNSVTIGLSAWYWWYYNSRYSREYALPQVDGLNLVSHRDPLSFLTTTVSIGLPVVPYVNPTLSLTHDYYTAIRKAGDLYAQVGLSHPFELIKEVTVTPGITASYYYSRSVKIAHYNIMMDPTTGALDIGSPTLSYSGPVRTITMNGIKQVRIPVRKGISDLTPNIVVTYTRGPVSLRGGFYWCIVPAKSWYNGGQIHRLYANIGVTYAI
jgi:hypothetical protein